MRSRFFRSIVPFLLFSATTWAQLPALDFDSGPGNSESALSSPILPDLFSVGIATVATRVDGQTDAVYSILFVVQGDSALSEVLVTPTGRPAFPLTYDATDGVFRAWSNGYSSLDLLRADFPLGEYLFDFNNGASSKSLTYPEVDPPCIPDITYPDQSCITSSTPTLTWTVAGECGLVMRTTLVDTGTDQTQFDVLFIPPSSGSVALPTGPVSPPTPGEIMPPQAPLMSDHDYRFDVLVDESTTTTEMVGADSFSYGVDFANVVERSFRVDEIGPCGPMGMDIDEVEIYASTSRVDGVPRPLPYDLTMNVSGANIESIAVQTPGGAEHELTEYDDDEWQYTAGGFDDLSEMASSFNAGFGTFVFTFSGQDGSEQTASVAYDPGGADPHSGYANIVFPADGQTDVALDPTYTWTCQNGPCGNFAWYMETFATTENGASYELDLLDPTATAWSPGTLTANTPYGFWITAGSLLGGTPEVLSTAPAPGDSFLYAAGFETSNEIEFATSSEPSECVIDWIGISADYGRVNGIPDSFPVDLYIEVYGAGIESVSVTTPGGVSTELTSEEAGVWEMEWSGYQDLDQIGNDPNVGFGEFTFDFVGELGEMSEIVLPYDPGPGYPVTGYCDITDPAHLETGVELDPSLTWVCEDTGDDCGTDGWLVYLEAFDYDLAYHDWLDRQQLSWTPGPIAPYSSYDFYCQTVKWLHGTPSMLSMAGKEFLYRAAFYTGESIEFQARERIVLTLSKQSPELDWTALTGETEYDVVRGDLGSLRGTEGDYSMATSTCIASSVPGSDLPFDLDPGPGVGWWILVRGGNAPDGYESLHQSQVQDRDAGIDASGNDCSP